jgi:hypothetical protein
MNNLFIAAELSHLSNQELEKLTERYYAGEKIKDLCVDYKIKCETKMLYSLLPPLVAVDKHCPNCSNIMILPRIPRNNLPSSKFQWRCSKCRHINHPDCKCTYCLQGNKIRDKSSAKITSKNHNSFQQIQTTDLTLEQVIAFFALVCCYPHEPGYEAFTVDKLNYQFSPSQKYASYLIDKLEEAKIICKVKRPIAAGAITASPNPTYFCWYLSTDQRYQLTTQISDIINSKHLPQSWLSDLSGFAFKVATEECMAFYNSYEKELKLPFIEKNVLAENFLNLTKNFSMDQCFLLIHNSAHAVADLLSTTKSTDDLCNDIFIASLIQHEEIEKNENSELSVLESLVIPHSNIVREILLELVNKLNENEDELSVITSTS